MTDLNKKFKSQWVQLTNTKPISYNSFFGLPTAVPGWSEDHTKLMGQVFWCSDVLKAPDELLLDLTEDHKLILGFPRTGLLVNPDWVVLTEEPIKKFKSSTLEEHNDQVLSAGKKRDKYLHDWLAGHGYNVPIPVVKKNVSASTATLVKGDSVKLYSTSCSDAVRIKNSIPDADALSLTIGHESQLEFIRAAVSGDLVLTIDGIVSQSIYRPGFLTFGLKYKNIYTGDWVYGSGFYDDMVYKVS